MQYAGLEAEHCKWLLDEAFENAKFGTFATCFQLTFTELEKQYLEIRGTRKELFEFDVLESNMDIDLELVFVTNLLTGMSRS